MKKNTTNQAWLHSLRQELKAMRCLRGARVTIPIYINVEDAIFTRLVEAEELLTVAGGLFAELAENKDNWLLRHRADIEDARWGLHNAISDRPCC